MREGLSKENAIVREVRCPKHFSKPAADCHDIKEPPFAVYDYWELQGIRNNVFENLYANPK